MIYYVVYMLQNKVPIARIIASPKSLSVNDIHRQYPMATTAYKKRTPEEAIEELEKNGFKQKYPMDTTYFVFV